MTEPDNTDAFDTLVRDALRQDARRAPQLDETWRGDTELTSTSPESSLRRRRFAIIGAVAASVLLITTLALVANQRRADVVPATNPTPRQPQGTEFPIVDLGPATEVTDGPVAESLTRRIGIEDHPDQILDTSLSYLGNDTAVEQRCVWEVNGGGACRPAWNGQTWTVSITSSIDNHLADRDLWRIEGLPDEAVFVSYADGDLQLWQRPVAGFAAFPNVDGDLEVVVAYDASGTEIGHYGAGQTDEQLDDVDVPPRADLSAAQQTELEELTTRELTDCLVSNGAKISAGDVATFAADIDQLTVWNSCVELVRAAVGEAVVAFDAPSQSSHTAVPTGGVGDLTPGETAVLTVGTHCGVGVLGRLVGGYVWRTAEADGNDWVPREWYSGPVPPDPIEVSVSLSDDGETLTASLNDREVTYDRGGQSFTENDQCA